MRSPKLGGSGSRQYYRYYAGYTQEFVEDMLRHLAVPSGGVVLDPWNGAGTTTVAAAAAGLNVRGFDVNPAAVIIGRARLIGSDVADSLVPIALDICDRAASMRVKSNDSDLLGTWFGPVTAGEIRALERATCRVLIDADSDSGFIGYDTSLRHSPLASLFYVALFRTVRNLVKKYVPSNPSWIKNPSGRRLGVPRSDLHDLFAKAVQLSNPYQGQLEIPLPTRDSMASVEVASSINLPLETASVDAVVSSPPYCTRLDYVKATLPELAVLGLGKGDIRQLRDQMIGTPTIAGLSSDVRPDQWGAAAADLLARVTAHSSVASATYYRKYYTQYFQGMWTSLNELHRVVKAGSPAVLVVQDSFYKDIHVDLPALVGDMSKAAGWSAWRRLNFNVPRTMAAINPRSRRYRENFAATESAVVLTR
ncbi:hypothetical protein [Actinoplanes sp. NPDC048796]|uniref:hypothetical protein n=1 Tax=Actinoplanes sp. NPDC048796 TaxID=3155640 RepID=UPI0033C2BC9A